MTNPGNALGTNGAYNGRTSVNAINDVLSGYDGRGILSGWRCVPKEGLTLAFGGNGVSRDVAIAQDDVGNKTTINNISEQPVDLTLAAAPSIGQRIDVIVAYVNNPPQVATPPAGQSIPIDNPEVVGLIDVQGDVVANNPVAPNEDAIRSAIGADGGVSSTAYYVIMATVEVGEGVTDITADNITPGFKFPKGTVDAALNPLSENPVQNKVITAKIQEIETGIGNATNELIRLDTGAGI